MEKNHFILIFLLAHLLQLSIVYAAVNFENNECSDDYGNYTKGIVYQHNLHRLFSNVSSQTSSRKFYNSTIGNFPNKVYGIYQCREDLSLVTCGKCIEDATRKITQVCHFYGEGIVWYDECMLRYANRSIFSLSETSPSADAWYDDSVSNYDKLAPVLEKTMNTVISQAARSSNRGHFATIDANWTMIDSISCLAQSTPDIDEFGCENCLTLALGKVYKFYNASMGVTIFYPSCQLSYVTNQKLKPAPSVPERRKRSSHIVVASTLTSIVLAILVLSGAGFCIYRQKCTKPPQDMEEIAGVESLQFDFKIIKDATDNFSLLNKLGQGGFGGVYKGKLYNGQQIAVKRLSANSWQGIVEFKTEILLAAKLQHNNLVKFLGYSQHEDEKLLVYELLPNTSLDKVMFGQERHQLLDWGTRYKILLGIARGILYLHEDSRLKIIHRDLKSSNILLDETMNPKISDFGLARLVETNQNHVDTSKVAGTYGYMAPEYALTGRFSFMSDVYSFGVIALEIVSGHMCSSTAFPYNEESLCIRAWKLWKDKATLDLVDPRLDGNYSSEEVARCIHIGLHCIQVDAKKRPTMATVVAALNGHLVPLSEPESPFFGVETNIKYALCKNEGHTSSDKFLENNDCITEVYPR